MNDPSPARFDPADGFARATRGLLIAGLVITAVSIASNLFQIEMLSRAATVGILEDEANASAARIGILALLAALVYVGTAAWFLLWIHRAYRNLRALGTPRTRFKPGWAVGGFFVPVLNLLRPYEIMREIWHGSDPAGLGRDARLGSASEVDGIRTPNLITGWWAFFLISCFFDNMTMRMSLKVDPTLADLRNLASRELLGNLLELPAAFFAIRLVGQITSWQGERIERVRARSAPLVADPG